MESFLGEFAKYGLAGLLAGVIVAVTWILLSWIQRKDGDAWIMLREQLGGRSDDSKSFREELSKIRTEFLAEQGRLTATFMASIDKIQTEMHRSNEAICERLERLEEQRLR